MGLLEREGQSVEIIDFYSILENYEDMQLGQLSLV